MMMSALLFLMLAAKPPVDPVPEFKYRDPADHWANELTDGAKKKFVAQYRQFPCARIPQYAADRDDRAIYWAIRDAGIFKDRGCSQFVETAMSINSDEVSMASHFYRYRLGDASQLAPLLKQFDDLGQQPGDSLLIELFGFLPDWQATGRRLARATAHEDGAGAETLATAFEWKRFLYGKSAGFVSTCRKVAAEEHVDEGWLLTMCGNR